MLHSIKTHSKKVDILKIDLSKAFDRVSWTYLQLMLTHIGFPHQFIKWVGSCFTTVSFNVLINGVTSNFFHVERGLRQGCPLSPMLFLLIMEGLNRLIKSTRTNGILGGVEINDRTIILHLLFVDGVLIFLNGSFKNTSSFKSVLSLFCKAIGMEPNFDKSRIIFSSYLPNEQRYASQHFEFIRQELEARLKYLGFSDLSQMGTTLQIGRGCL